MFIPGLCLEAVLQNNSNCPVPINLYDSGVLKSVGGVDKREIFF